MTRALLSCASAAFLILVPLHLAHREPQHQSNARIWFQRLAIGSGSGSGSAHAVVAATAVQLNASNTSSPIHRTSVDPRIAKMRRDIASLDSNLAVKRAADSASSVAKKAAHVAEAAKAAALRAEAEAGKNAANAVAKLMRDAAEV